MSKLAVIMISGLGLSLTACGGDDEGKPVKTSAKKSSAKTKKRAGASSGAAKGALSTYVKVEALVAEDEAKRLRHKFTPDVFAPDPTGDENRDPFHSFLIGAATKTDAAVISGPITSRCKRKDQLKATTESINNLELTGIIWQGSQSIAQFRDSRGQGYIVRRNDCLGSEKAKVIEVFGTYVRTEIIPENTLEGGDTIKNDIPLHPEELRLKETGGE